MRRSGGISALARQLGETPAATTSAVDAILPGMLDDFLHFEGGLSALLGLIEAAGGGAMAQAIMVQDKVDIKPGLMILARVSRSVSPSSDKVSPDLRDRIMPLLAMLLGGYLSARAATGELDEAEVAKLLDSRKTFYSPGEEQV